MGDDWKPIETAPKDGTVVLGYAANAVASGEQSEFPDMNICPTQWANGADGFDWQLPWLVYEGPMYDDIGPSWYRPTWAPTHWMPLPPPPAK